MRLIDADALPIWSYAQMWEEGQGIKKCCDAVENAPTIEAITIDWILTWWSYQGVPSMSHHIENTDKVMRAMLRDWMDENNIKELDG